MFKAKLKNITSSTKSLILFDLSQDNLKKGFTNTN